jgi:hypothetical protein
VRDIDDAADHDIVRAYDMYILDLAIEIGDLIRQCRRADVND